VRRFEYADTALAGIEAFETANAAVNDEANRATAVEDGLQ
jgi:hypothetical protein